MDEQNYEDIMSCLSEEEKKEIEGKNFFEKIKNRIKMKKVAKKAEVFDAMIANIENNDITNIIPEEYKQEKNKE